ncbi:hypothetical protein C8J55DRAFT_551543 [Lentinula edodes]|uniref:AMP-dependent synthetase/ligase domain-containing protein n=1 Tax=Lentinula lateritia TaxID=40482 RepID=A0A9W9DGT8_9AGAR|nr:hypothetical protein C8J55DRAFT_551543 [Lentinula edodes]
MHFVPPPPTLAVELQFDFHFSHNPNYPVFLHTQSDGALKSYTYSDIVPAIHRCASSLLSSISVNYEKTPVIAFISSADALTYSMVLLGILRAGMTAFPISPRFTPDVIAHLISAVKPTHIIMNAERAATTDQIMRLTNSEDKPIVLPMPTYHDIFCGESNLTPINHQRHMEEPAVIIHSSGSTSQFPKTITWSSLFYLNNAQTIGMIVLLQILTMFKSHPDFVSQNINGKVIGLQSLEPFHSLGICFISWMARVGFVMALLDPEDSASLIPASSDVIYNSYQQTSPSLIYAGANLLEIWSEDPEKIDFLKSMSAVITAGRVLNRHCARKLLDSNVLLTIGYGSTETGSLSILDSLCAHDWEYFCPPIPEIKFIVRDDGLLSLTVLSTERRRLPVCNTIYQGKPGYDTGDLFREHRSRKGYFAPVGRLGDQLMLSTGEMVDPDAIESKISHLPPVESVMLFGNSRPFIGVIVEVTQKFDLTSKEFRNHLIDYIWESIQEIDQEQTSSAHVAKKMIILTDYQKPIPRGTKGMPMRVLALEQFESEIHALYN